MTDRRASVTSRIMARVAEVRSYVMKTVAAILKYKGHQVTTIEPTATVAHIVAVLTELRIGSVLVTDRTNRLLGLANATLCARSQRTVRKRWR